ncbi:nucleoside-specific channel-forming protein [Pseudomonas putida]|nr:MULTISPECIES: nucleoside-specific channel-forming protein Tsx [Pseudomonas]MCS4061312.1 nucleoside-specific channel-forming protein [Pseudomonas putida]
MYEINDRFGLSGAAPSRSVRVIHAGVLVGLMSTLVTASAVADSRVSEDLASTSAQGQSLDPTLTTEERTPPSRDFFSHSVSVVGSSNIKFGPKPVDDVYAEYEYYGRTGVLEYYGYIDLPKIFGVGNKNDHGAWDDGSPLFMEHEPRISIDGLAGRSFAFGPFKEFYVAFDWLYDHGDTSQSRSNVLYSGLGTDIETRSPLNLSFNLYAKRNWENYSAATEYSWDGYRAQFNYNLPVADFGGGRSLSYSGYTNYDFDSKTKEKQGGAYADNSLVLANRFTYLDGHFQVMLTAYYFHNSSYYRDGAEIDYGDGPFKANADGIGYTVGLGYKF